MSQLAIDQLPDLCLWKIFSYFGLRDLTSSRAVCLLFKFYADQAKVHELVVTWDGTKPSTCPDNIISVKAFLSLKPSQFGPHQQVHSLDIHLDDCLIFLNLCLDFDMFFQHLNSFKQLIRLKLTFEFEFKRIRGELTLPNLRDLYIRGYFHGRLKTPKLEALQCDYIQSVELEYPETIKELKSGYPGAIVMAKFKNLEVFRCRWVDYELDRDLLSTWKQLRKLDFEFSSSYNGGSFEMFRNSLAHIVSQNATSKRELEIWLNDVPLLDSSQLDDAELEDFDRPSNFKIKYYKWLPADYSYDDVNFVNYNRLMDMFGGELPPDFFEKFPLITTIEATGVVDRDQFEWFLKSVGDLKYLKLIYTLLDQTFMDRLPNISDRLTELEVMEAPNSITNFDFILQLTQLCEFTTNQQFDAPLDLAAKVFQQLTSFCLFRFAVSVCGRVRIERFSSSEDSSSEDSFELYTCEMDSKYVGNRESEVSPTSISGFPMVKDFLPHLKWAELVDLYEQKKRELLLLLQEE